jgi:hypothetical protein
LLVVAAEVQQKAAVVELVDLEQVQDYPLAQEVVTL